MCNNDAAETNVWLSSSELALCGRPLSDEVITLPLSREIYLPEELAPEKDLRQAERQRPSQETTSAQKGTGRWIALLRSALTSSGNSLKSRPIICVNLTGYVEDLGCAVS